MKKAHVCVLEDEKKGNERKVRVQTVRKAVLFV